MKTTIAVFTVGFVVLTTFVPSSFARTRHHVKTATVHCGNALGAPSIFSDLDSDAETGDIGGMQVILLQVPEVGWAVVTTASGDFNAPVLVEATYHENQIEFTLPDGESGGVPNKFTGKISRAGLTLWNGKDLIGFLPRQSASCYP